MRKLAASSVAALALLALAAPAGASAATEVGGTCVANDTETGWTVIPVPGAGDSLPIVVPAAGVLTAWKLDVAAAKGPLEHRFQVFRPLGAQFVPVAESAPVAVVDGANVYPDRIPVQAGDRFGLHGTVETLFCDKTDVFNMARFDGPIPLGVPQTFQVNAGEGSPLRAVVEPDADGDGHGDESQDGCPASPLYQGACPPPVELRVTRKVFRRAVVVRVRASGEASVDVYGQVRWKVRPKGRTRSGKPKPNRRLTQGLSGGLGKPVVAGTARNFRVALPKTVKRRLSRLTRKQALRPVLTVRATDSLGQVTVKRIKPKLRGWRRR